MGIAIQARQRGLHCPRRFGIAALVCTMLFGMGAAPAYAQYGGNPGWSLGGSAFWVTRSLFNPRRLGYVGGAHAAGPLYWASNIYGAAAQIGTYGIQGPQLNLNRQIMEAEPYEDEEPINDPRDRVRARRPAKVAVDQSVHAKWLKADVQPFRNEPAPPYQPSPAEIDPFFVPLEDRSAPGAGGPMTGCGKASPAVPWTGSPFSDQHKPVDAGQPAPAAGGNPLAAGFVNLVNAKFNGDIGKALSDKDARSWAQSLGLNTYGKLTHRRVEVVRGILNDQSIDSLTKIETITALLRR